MIWLWIAAFILWLIAIVTRKIGRAYMTKKLQVKPKAYVYGKEKQETQARKKGS